MITDYDLNILDYQGIKRTNRDCKLSIGGDEDENGPCQVWVTYAQNTVWGHVFFELIHENTERTKKIKTSGERAVQC